MEFCDLFVGHSKIAVFWPIGTVWHEMADFRVPQTHAPKSHTKMTDQILILSSIESLYRSLSSPGARYSMCTHQAHPPTFYDFEGQIFRSHFPRILGVRSQNDHGCACWVHILGPALGVNKGLIWVYKPSKFHVLTPLASTRRRRPHFTTRIGSDLRIFIHIYHGSIIVCRQNPPKKRKKTSPFGKKFFFHCLWPSNISTSFCRVKRIKVWKIF